MEDKELSRNQAVRQPSIAELTAITTDLGFKCSEDEVKDMQEYFKETVKSYQTVYDMVEPTLPVKYPRTPGHREISDNAWYWRCDIKGADCGLLSQKTIGIKDNIAVAGVPMMAGSRLLEGYTPEFDATVVTRILDAGGRIKGKTSCEDLSLGGNSWTCSTGPVRNPYDATRSAGGSSSGSASLVARGMVDMALGTCQAGSIRLPCSWCGLVGLKPTRGLVPYTGVIPIEYTIDHIGTITKTVADCAVMLEVIAGYDGGRDSRQTPGYVVPEYSKMLNREKKDIRMGMLVEGFERCDAGVSKCVREAAKCMTSSGVTLEDVSIPIHRNAPSIVLPINMEGKYNMMMRCNDDLFSMVDESELLIPREIKKTQTCRKEQRLFSQGALFVTFVLSAPTWWKKDMMHSSTVNGVGIKKHLMIRLVTKICMLKRESLVLTGLGKNYKGHYSTSLQEALTRGFSLRPFDTSITVKMACVWGEYIQRNYQGKFYSKAQNMNQVLTKAYDSALEKYDVLVLPTATEKPFILPTKDQSTLDQLNLSTTMYRNTAPFNITGHPALTINAGFSDGLPVGMMFVGRHFDDLTVLQAAHLFELVRLTDNDQLIM